MELTADGVGYSAAIVLAVVFAWSAVTKIRDPEATAEAFSLLGVPNPTAASRLLPFPEIAVVVLLLVAPAAGAIAVLVLLAFFTTFLIGRIRAGVDAPCACFGSGSHQPISWLTVARNVRLGVLALAALLTLRPARPTLVDALVVLGMVVVGSLGLRLAAHRWSPDGQPMLPS